MELSYEDLLILNSKDFIEKVKNNFQSIEDVSLVFLSIHDEYGTKQYEFSPKNNIFPLKITIIHNGYVSRYKFLEKNECDDEYSLTGIDGQNIAYNEFKKFIVENLACIKNKDTFNEHTFIHSDNIEEKYNKILPKIDAIKLNNELKGNNSNKLKRIKM